MSIRAYGMFDFKKCVQDQQIEDFSFKVVNLATNNQIGILLGIIVPHEFRDKYLHLSNTLVFELIDHPLTNVAEVLLRGDGVIVRHNGKRIDKDEKLDSRLTRLQNFFSSVFTLGISQIMLTIDGDFGEEVLLETNIQGFKRELLRLYLAEKGLTPVIKCIISDK